MEPSADAGAIKTAYRKLVLKCHPDKFPDPTLKAQKQEEFQKVQQAYEILGDDDRRRDYDLEVKHKKLKEELAKRGGSATTSTPAQSRYVNVNIRTAEPPPGMFTSKHSTSKSSPYKPYSKEYSQSWEHEIPSRSKAYHDDERRARRTASYEKPKREDSRERRRREEDRIEREDRERAARRRERKDREEEAVRKEIKRQQKLNDEREAAREREILRKERKEREAREARVEAARLKEAKEAKKMREREREREREARRKLEAEDKAKVKSKQPYLEHPPYSEEDEDVQRSRAKKSSSPKKQSDSPSRDKSAKQRERANPVEAGAGEEKYRGHMAFAASYINQIKSKTSKTSPKHTAEVPTYSAAYPDPNEKWAPKRRSSGDGKHAKDEPIIVDAPEPDQTQPEVVSPPSNTQQAPPRLQKSHTMPPGYVPQAQTTAPLPPRIPLNRAATMQPEYEYNRPAEKHRSARKRTSFDDDYVQDYYQPPIQTRYHVSSRDSGVPRIIDAKYRDPYGAGVTFPKVKTAPAYRPEHVATSRHYGEEDVMTSEYMQPHYEYRPAAAAR